MTNGPELDWLSLSFSSRHPPPYPHDAVHVGLENDSCGGVWIGARWRWACCPAAVELRGGRRLHAPGSKSAELDATVSAQAPAREPTHRGRNRPPLWACRRCLCKPGSSWQSGNCRRAVSGAFCLQGRSNSAARAPCRSPFFSDGLGLKGNQPALRGCRLPPHPPKGKNAPDPRGDQPHGSVPKPPPLRKTARGVEPSRAKAAAERDAVAGRDQCLNDAVLLHPKRRKQPAAQADAPPRGGRALEHHERQQAAWDVEAARTAGGGGCGGGVGVKGGAPQVAGGAAASPRRGRGADLRCAARRQLEGAFASSRTHVITIWARAHTRTRPNANRKHKRTAAGCKYTRACPPRDDARRAQREAHDEHAEQHANSRANHGPANRQLAPPVGDAVRGAGAAGLGRRARGAARGSVPPPERRPRPFTRGR